MSGPQRVIEVNAAYSELLNGWHRREFGGGDPDPAPFEVVAMLCRLGERLCEYGGGEWIDRRCDCKFMVHDQRWSEESGCAEVRTALVGDSAAIRDHRGALHPHDGGTAPQVTPDRPPRC